MDERNQYSDYCFVNYNCNDLASSELFHVASLYLDAYAAAREQRLRAARNAATSLIRAGQAPSSPTFTTTPLAQISLLLYRSVWHGINRKLPARCDEIGILTLDGWRETVFGFRIGASGNSEALQWQTFFFRRNGGLSSRK